MRALRVLGEVSVLACEDTRFTRKIFARHEIESPRTLLSYHEHNKEQAAKRIVGFLEDGVDVALCTDGGLPGISDPGYRVIAQAIACGAAIEVVPGASAPTTALLASGLSTASFTFKGFPPRKSGARKRFLDMERDLPHTIILFESPYRLGKLLDDAYEVLGNRQAAVCIELTKKFEHIERGFLEDLATHFGNVKVRGEITVIISGNNPKFTRDCQDISAPS